MNWRVGLGIIFAAITISAMLTGLNRYSVGETIFLLLVLWAMMLATVLFYLAFVLLRAGGCLGWCFVKAKVLRVIGLSARHLGSGEGDTHPSHAPLNS